MTSFTCPHCNGNIVTVGYTFGVNSKADVRDHIYIMHPGMLVPAYVLD